MTTGGADGPIFVLEDDADVAALFRRGLEEAGFKVEICPSLAAFDRALDGGAPALAVIDLNLPDGDGLALLGGARARARAPCIVVTGRDRLSDRLEGLERGADDYLVKPVDPRELAARVRAVLRRARSERTEDPTPPDGARDIARFAGFTADFDRLTLAAPDGRIETLGQADAQLLRTFLDAPGRVLSREFLLDASASGAEELFDRAIDVRVSRLRKKLRDSPRGAKHIRTVYGAGYVFSVPVRWGAEERDP